MRTVPVCVRILVSPFQQYHNERVNSRDKSIVHIAKELSLPGYKTSPFSQAKVEQFLRDFSEYRTEAKRKADAEKASCLVAHRTGCASSGDPRDWSCQFLVTGTTHPPVVVTHMTDCTS